MTFVSRSRFLYSCILIFCRFVLCHGTDRCEPHNCSQAVRGSKDQPFTCTIGRTTECEAFKLRPIGRPVHPVMPPMLHSLNVYRRDLPPKYKNSPTLNVSWILPNDWYSLNRTKAIHVIVNSVENFWYANNTPCRIFDFSKTVFTSYDVQNPRILTYPCFYGLDERMTTTYIFNVTSLPEQIRTFFYVTVAVKPSSIWRPAIAFWKISKLRKLRVWFENTPPVGVNITKWEITLYREKDECGAISKSVLVKIISMMQFQESFNTVTFEDVKLGRYFVKVSPLGCEPKCNITKSFCLPVNDDGGWVDLPNRKPPTKPAVDPGEKVKDAPIMRHVGREDDRSMKIILGTIFGVVTGVMLVIILTYLYKHSKSRCIQQDKVLEKGQPTVLLLYCNDCPQHFKVVQQLADCLIQVCKFSVHFDGYERASIQDTGAHEWLQDQMAAANCIIVVCSLGGRLRCKSERLNKDCPLGENFSAAISEISQKLREETKRPDLPKTKMAVVYMSYSTATDIPHQLAMLRKYHLKNRSNLEELYRYLMSTDRLPEEFCTITRPLEQLEEYIEDTKKFFRENNKWVDEWMQENKKDPKHKHKSDGKNSEQTEPLIKPNKGNSISQDNLYSGGQQHRRCGSYGIKVVGSHSQECLSRNQQQRSNFDGTMGDNHRSLKPRSVRSAGDTDSDNSSTPKLVQSLVDVHRSGNWSDDTVPSSSKSNSASVHSYSSSSSIDLQKDVSTILNPIFPCDALTARYPKNYRCPIPATNLRHRYDHPTFLELEPMPVPFMPNPPQVPSEDFFTSQWSSADHRSGANNLPGDGACTWWQNRFVYIPPPDLIHSNSSLMADQFPDHIAPSACTYNPCGHRHYHMPTNAYSPNSDFEELHPPSDSCPDDLFIPPVDLNSDGSAEC